MTFNNDKQIVEFFVKDTITLIKNLDAMTPTTPEVKAYVDGLKKILTVDLQNLQGSLAGTYVLQPVGAPLKPVK